MSLDVQNIKSVNGRALNFHNNNDNNQFKVVAISLNILANFPTKRSDKWKEVEECEDEDGDVESKEVRAFKRDVFYVMIDSAISGLTTRFDAANNIYKTLSFLW